MEIRRFFVDQIQADQCQITGEEYRHIVKVLRLRKGDSIILSQNDGMDREAVIEEITEKALNARIVAVRRNLNETKRPITLFQDLLKGDKLEQVIQKSVELGVREIVPFESKFTTVKIKGKNNLERLQKISMEAAKQCDRACYAKVSEYIPFQEMLLRIRNFSKVIYACEFEQTGQLQQALEGNYENIALIVGSEGGFSREEYAQILANGAIPITMGNRILRAETAAIALTAAVCFATGEWEKRS